MTSTTTEWGRKERLVILGFLCAAGLALRVALTLGSPNLPYPDEAFLLEQAHRIVRGYGITPIDWRMGQRSWYSPGLIAPAFWLGGHVLPMRNPCLLAASLFLGLISLAPVICEMGQRSWYSPGLIAPAFWLGGHVLPMRNPCLLAASLFLGLISLAPVIC